MLSRAPDRQTDDPIIRRELRDGDAEAIAELHRRNYSAAYGMNERFVSAVAAGVRDAAARGWPRSGGAVWLIERAGAVAGSLAGSIAGSLALTVEPERAGDTGAGRARVGRVRWFVLDRSLRGRGLGRALMAELLDEARAAGLAELELETFAALSAAAHIYRAAGFRVVSEREREDWGRPITYQRYELHLR
jgi:GNAT superfamily N-acetyltransferase